MPNIKTITLHTGKNLLAVEELPEGADWFEMDTPLEDQIVYQCDDKDDLLITLPPGSYTLIGFLNDCGEEVAKGLVENYFVAESYGHGTVYKDYKRTMERGANSWTCATALESLHSLLTSEGVVGNCLLILEK